jgi:hypothetical protein
LKIEVASSGESAGANAVAAATGTAGAATGLPARNRSMSARIAAALW